MLIVLSLAIRNILRRKRTSISLASLVAAAVLIFVLGASLLSSTSAGIKSEFQEYYTGEAAIRANSDRQFGVMGFTVPLISSYEMIPSLSQVDTIEKILKQNKRVQSWTKMVSTGAELETVTNDKKRVLIFGVAGTDYFKFFSKFVAREGSLTDLPEDQAWVILPASIADDLAKSMKRTLKIGEQIQFTAPSSTAFTIRVAKLAAIITTKNISEKVYPPVYLDVNTARDLAGLARTIAPTPTSDNPDATSTTTTEEDFFGSADAAVSDGDTAAEAPKEKVADSGNGDLLEDFLKSPAPQALPRVDGGAWNFILLKFKPHISTVFILADINKELQKAKIDTIAVPWLKIADFNANLLYFLQGLFAISMLILVSIIALMLTNSLVFAVMEEERDIASIRAMGATRNFVHRVYFARALMITLAGAVVGVALALLAIRTLNNLHIPINNNYLIMLFSSHEFHSQYPVIANGLVLAGCLLISYVASFYPVKIAMPRSIAVSMNEE